MFFFCVLLFQKGIIKYYQNNNKGIAKTKRKDPKETLVSFKGGVQGDSTYGATLLGAKGALEP